MGSTEKNPCANCSVNCCKTLSGLRVSEAEYQQHFGRFEARLDVKQVDRLYVVSAKAGTTCPHFIGEQCSVYVERPMECRLFPYTLREPIQEGNRVQLFFEASTKCPRKDTLIMPQAKAKAMITVFAQGVYNDFEKIKVERKWLLTRAKFKMLRFLRARRPAQSGPGVRRAGV